jgi:hypothetical protein
MGVYRSYSCPRCRKTLLHSVPWGSKGVGEPVRECPKCRASVNIRQLCTEWELMDEPEKSGIRRRVWWTAAQMGGACGVLLPFIFGAWILEKVGIQGTSFRDLAGPLVSIVLAGGTAGFLIHFKLVRKQLQKQIADSEGRMRDPEYRKKLLALGLLTRPSQ